jgi:hypothetical protein
LRKKFNNLFRKNMQDFKNNWNMTKINQNSENDFILFYPNWIKSIFNASYNHFDTKIYTLKTKNMALFIIKRSKNCLKGAKTFFGIDFESRSIHGTLKSIRQMKDEIECNNTTYKFFIFSWCHTFKTYAGRCFRNF